EGHRATGPGEAGVTARSPTEGDRWIGSGPAVAGRIERNRSSSGIRMRQGDAERSAWSDERAGVEITTVNRHRGSAVLSNRRRGRKQPHEKRNVQSTHGSPLFAASRL